MEKQINVEVLPEEDNISEMYRSGHTVEAKEKIKLWAKTKGVTVLASFYCGIEGCAGVILVYYKPVDKIIVN